MSIKSGKLLPMVTDGLFYTIKTAVSGDTLDASPAVILRQYIKDVITLLQLPSGDAIWPAYIGSMPDGGSSPDNCICLYDVPGVKDGRLMDGPSIDHFGVQLKVRALDYQTGWTHIIDICSGLDAIVNYEQEYDSAYYCIANVSKVGSVMALGNEEETKRRFLFTANFLITLKQVET